MSDSNASNGNNAPIQGQPQSGDQSAQPDFSKMTGAEAKAWVEAQKAAKEGSKQQPPVASKQAPKPDSQKTAPEANKEAISDAAKEAIRKLKIKHDNGNEEEIDEQEIIKIYKERKGHQRAANKELQEGKALRKQAEEFINMMKDKGKLFEAIKKLGHDPRGLAEEYLAAQLQEELMDPREKEFRDAKLKLQQYEELERKQQQEIEKRRLDELKAKYAKDYETQFIEALKGSQLPQTKAMVAEMAKYISRSAKIGFKMSPQEAASLVKEDIERATKSLYGNSDGETLLRLLGDDVANKMLQARGSKVKSPESHLTTPKDQDFTPRERGGAPNKRMSAKEWREFNRKK